MPCLAPFYRVPSLGPTCSFYRSVSWSPPTPTILARGLSSLSSPHWSSCVLAATSCNRPEGVGGITLVHSLSAVSSWHWISHGNVWRLHLVANPVYYILETHGQAENRGTWIICFWIGLVSTPPCSAQTWRMEGVTSVLSCSKFWIPTDILIRQSRGVVNSFLPLSDSWMRLLSAEE